MHRVVATAATNATQQDDQNGAHSPNILRAPRRRRSSLLDRWIDDQRNSTASSNLAELADAFNTVSIGATPVNPYLAYPDMRRSMRRPRDEVSTLHSYDLIEVEEAQEAQADVDLAELNPMPTTPNRGKFSPSSIRHHLRFPFRSSSPSPSISAASSNTTSHARSPSRASLSLLPRVFRPSTPTSPVQTPTQSTTPPPNTQSRLKNTRSHNRSSSLSMLYFNTEARTPTPMLDVPRASTPTSAYLRPSSPTRTKWRPSVLGHFSSASSSSPSQSSVGVPSEAAPRPSMSSVQTYTSTYMSDITDSSHPGHALSFNPHHESVFKSQAGTDSSLSVWSSSNHPDAPRTRSISAGNLLIGKGALGNKPVRTPFTPKHSHNGVVALADAERETRQTASRRTIDLNRPYVAYTSGKASSRGTLSSLASSTRTRRQKQLVVSGVGIDEESRFEAVKRWCENFGKVAKITRMPNADLHIRFQDPEVAHQVCRLRAQVIIAGAGSVTLSWCMDKK